MGNMLKNRAFLIMTAITVLFISFIFLHSSMTGDTSSNESSSVLVFVQSIINALCIPITLSELLIRKVAHFSEFAVLGVLVSTTFYIYDKTLKKYIKRLLSVFFICLATAVTDETIQLFVPGRSGQVSDVLIDFSGAFTGVIIVSVILMIIYRKKTKNRN